MHHFTRSLFITTLIFGSSSFAEAPPDQAMACKEVTGATLNLLILKPKLGNENHPGFLFFHGGGIVMDSRTSSITPL